MPISKSFRSFLFLGMVLLGQCVIFRTVAFAQFTPKHSVVKKMVDRGLKFLEGYEAPERGLGTAYSNGAEIMAGYAVYKVTSDSSHPLVVSAVQRAQLVARAVTNPDAYSEKIVYEAGVAGVFLASVNVDVYRAECEAIRDFFIREMRPYGGSGYLNGVHDDTADVSQTQYAMLCFWTLDQLGVSVPAEPVERSARWLLQVQDPSGGWPYQGQISRTGGRVKQENVSFRMTGAGLCALLLAGDFLNFYRNRRAPDEEDYIPAAYIRVIEDVEKKRITMDREDFEPALNAGVRAVGGMPARGPGKNWWYYNLYTVERYQAFLEIRSNPKNANKSPPWYNQGVRLLQELQDSDGGWGVNDRDHTGPRVCTAFSILFLIRSTQKAIGEVSQSVEAGGYGFPQDLANIGVVNGKVVDRNQSGTLDDLLENLGEDGTADLNNVVVSQKMKLADNPKRRKEQLNRLRQLVRNGDWQARRVAARLIGRGEDLAYVPDLIFALTDDDSEVPKLAESSLRILSRKLDVELIPLDKVKPTEVDRQNAVEFWKDWYLGLRPDFVFVD